MPPSTDRPGEGLTFTYHKESSSLRTFVYGIMTLMVMCDIPVVVLLFFYLKSTIGRGVVLALIALELLVLVYILPSLLLMRHGIEDNNLIVRLGIRFKGIIPLGNIKTADPVNGVRPKDMSFGVHYDRERDMLCVMAGGKKAILIRLKKPQQFRISLFRFVLASSVTMNVDEIERFLDALRLRLPVSSDTAVQVSTTGIGEPDSESPADKDVRLIPHGLASPVIAFTGTERPLGTALEVQSLEKYYGSFKAVDRIGLRIQPGEIYGFMGPNGAGKTTTMNMVTGLLRPSGGQIRIFGRDVWEEPLAAKKFLGYVAEHPLVYDRLTGREFVRFSAELYRTPRAGLEERVGQLLAGFELTDAADDLIMTYSQGMRRKIALAAVVVHSPGLLVLDEPTNGVDPKGAWVIKNLLRSLSEQGAAVLMSTHVLEVAEIMCDHVAIIDKGRIVAEGTINDLKEQAQMPESNLEDVFLALTGQGNDRERTFTAR